MNRDALDLSDETELERETIDLNNGYKAELVLHEPEDIDFINYVITADLMKKRTVSGKSVESEVIAAGSVDDFAPKSAELVERLYGRHMLNWEPPTRGDNGRSDFRVAADKVRGLLRTQ